MDSGASCAADCFSAGLALAVAVVVAGAVAVGDDVGFALVVAIDTAAIDVDRLFGNCVVEVDVDGVIGALTGVVVVEIATDGTGADAAAVDTGRRSLLSVANRSAAVLVRA